jgi:hypothetical protein
MMKNLDTKKQIKETDCLIIDEISMISRATLEKVEFLCTKVRNNDFAFGKIQVIGSGDFFQLAPVPNALYGDFGHSCLESPIFSNVFPHHIELSTAVRQSEVDLIRAVGRVKSTSGLQVINFHPSLVRKHPSIVYKFDSVPSPEVSAEL